MSGTKRYFGWWICGILSTTALLWGAPKEGTLSPSGKIEGALLEDILASRRMSLSPPGGVGTSVGETKSILVEAISDRDIDGISAQVKACGGALKGIYGSWLDVDFPMSQLALMEGWPGIRRVSYHHKPKALGLTGEHTTLMGAKTGQSNGAWGSSVSVAVIDLGFSNVVALQNSGDLPSQLTLVDFTGTGAQTGTIHGSAVAEIIHEEAPGAKLHLLKVANSVQLGQAVAYCKTNGVRIINHSVGWFNTSFGDGTGAICQIASDAHQAGILWFNSAGNEAECHYSGDFNGGLGGYQVWSGGDSYNQLGYYEAGRALYAYLCWNDPWAGTWKDFDLYLYRWSGTNWVLKGGSENVQAGTQTPTEALGTVVSEPGYYALRVKHYSGTSLAKVSLFASSTLQYRNPASSIPEPGNSEKVLTVGAVAVSNWSAGGVETFSSRGPTADGRVKPDLVALDDMSNTLYGRFLGTSAASPAAAGVAALLMGEYTNDSVQSIRSNILGGCAAGGLTGTPQDFGVGKLIAKFRGPSGSASLSWGKSFVTNPAVVSLNYVPYRQTTPPVVELRITTNGWTNYSSVVVPAGSPTWTVGVHHGETVQVSLWLSNFYGQTNLGTSPEAKVDETAATGLGIASLPSVSLPKVYWAWTNASDPESGIVGYQLEVSGDSNFSRLERVVSNLNTNGYQTGPHIHGSVLWCRVTARNGAGQKAIAVANQGIRIDGQAPTTRVLGGVPRAAFRPLTIQLEADEPGATIYFSTNGTFPGVREENIYRGPFSVGKTTSLTYFAMDSLGNQEESKSEQIQFLPTPVEDIGVYGNLLQPGHGGMRLLVKQGGTYRLSILDPFRRQVKVFEPVSLANQSVWEWDGLVDGKALASRGYFLKVEGPTGTVLKRLAVE